SAPDVAVLGGGLGELNGIDALSSISSESWKIVLFTAPATLTEVLSAIVKGGRGVLLREAAPERVAQWVGGVVGGGDQVSPSLMQAALERENGRELVRELLKGTLTAREREVMRLVSEGLPNKEVARRLMLSEGTVKMYLHHIFDKLGVPNRTALTALAIA